ncbi:hypothetical protein T484DRAFT_1758910 [Baffinella frigidus]|nr:hypothetical protein T484DRAFT_1758910 [Cryptophyta sp. CCMP2293]
MTIQYKTINIKTGPGITVWEITSHIREMLEESGVKNGFVNVISRHTTTALTINEYEGRLRDDMREFFAKLAPPSHPYLHNVIHERPNPGEGAERYPLVEQEPINAHSHLLSMMLGNSETIPVADGKMMIGQWQNVLFLDLDGDRERTVGVQIVGIQ